VTGYDNIQYASLSDVGVRRSFNEDACAQVLAPDAEKWREQGHIFLVADGLGAHAVGELASELAVNIIPHIYHKHAQQGAAVALRMAFFEANASIHARGQQNLEFKGMGTTSTVLLLRPEGAWIGHVGDSRAYRARGDQIEQLSFDHSLVWELARQQHIDPDGLQGIPSNVIVRSLGPEPLVQVDVEGPHPVQDGDVFVLCSDGLSGQVSDHEIGAVAGALQPAEACRFLVDLANLRGGPDNITVQVVRVGGTGAPAPAVGVRADLPPWYRRVPWPLSTLLLGVVLAGGAAALTYGGLPGAGPTFVLAAVVLLAGLVGLVFHQAGEQRRQAEEVEYPPSKVYRKASCRIEQALLNRIIKADETLEQWGRARQWDIDWAAHRQHRQAAEEAVRRGELPAAFRDYARAMQVLMTEALQRQRTKQEVFEPLWDKQGA
jgi:protein phosphatase